MTQDKPFITCIGLANVDVIAETDDRFLEKHHISKGASTLLDSCTTGTILAQLDGPAFFPGGCAANVACGLAAHGVAVRFIGKVGDDPYAGIFMNGFKGTGIEFPAPVHPQKMTSMCLTLVTPDKERSFVFCTDAAGFQLAPADLPEPKAGFVNYIYLETNTAHMPVNHREDNVLEAAVARYGAAGARIVLNLTDREIIIAARPAIERVMKQKIDFIIGNIGELFTLFDVHDMALAFARAHETGKNFIITNGSDGAYILRGGQVIHVPGVTLPAHRIVNTVGAGDQFAAGFVAGVATGLDWEEACRQGIDAATAIIQDTGARPRMNKAV